MTNYPAEAEKTVKKIAETSKDENLQKGASSIVETAKSYAKDASEMASEGVKYIKREGKKDLHKAEAYVKDHPVKSLAYIAGVGALLTYLFRPKK